MEERASDGCVAVHRHKVRLLEVREVFVLELRRALLAQALLLPGRVRHARGHRLLAMLLQGNLHRVLRDARPPSAPSGTRRHAHAQATTRGAAPPPPGAAAPWIAKQGTRRVRLVRGEGRGVST